MDVTYKSTNAFGWPQASQRQFCTTAHGFAPQCFGSSDTSARLCRAMLEQLTKGSPGWDWLGSLGFPQGSGVQLRFAMQPHAAGRA